MACSERVHGLVQSFLAADWYVKDWILETIPVVFPPVEIIDQMLECQYKYQGTIIEANIFTSYWCSVGLMLIALLW